MRSSASIIIPIYNRLQLTQQGIRSLYAALDQYDSFGGKTYEFSVVVVDDGSTDGSSNWIHQNYPSIHVMKGDGHLWWTGSINRGARYAIDKLGSDFVVLWNDDTYCESDYFIELDKLLNKKAIYKESILAAKVYWQDQSNTLFNYGCYYSPKTGKKKVIGLNELDSEQFNHIIPIDWSGGMGTVIPAKILVELDYFDAAKFPQYHGDIDFFLRAGKRGYQSYAVPMLKLYNNRESTGISKTRTWEDLSRLFTSNRSNHNIVQNFSFNYKHANTITSWVWFCYKYLVLTTRSLQTIVWR